MVGQYTDFLDLHLQKTERILNDLLSKEPFCGYGKIIPNLDLGFPHDVIRLAGGFATGICIFWETKESFVPIDICMNACTVSLYKLNHECCFTRERIIKLIENLNKSSYIANFHRGNHFISFLEEVTKKTKYIMIHSSAAEFETCYNGLYPVEGNYFYNNMEYYYSGQRCIRYLKGKVADLYLDMASGLYQYNENRHNFIISALVEKDNIIEEVKHYHHYGMPSKQVALLGSHVIKKNGISPLLTRQGENVYLIRYKNVFQENLKINANLFITPHGLGKCHSAKTQMMIDYGREILNLDSLQYKIKYGESLRAHPGLKIRDINMIKYFSYFSQCYDYSIVKEFKQIASYNKSGFIDWNK